MAINSGNNGISGIFAGGHEISKVSVGSQLVWAKSAGANQGITIYTTKQLSFSIKVNCSVYGGIFIDYNDGTIYEVNSYYIPLHSFVNPGLNKVTITGNLTNITNLTCSSQQVTSVELDNITDYSNIDYFNFDNNLIEIVNLPSSITSLAWLKLNNNPNLTTLNWQVTHVIALYLNYCTNLKYVSFSELISVKYLYIYNSPSIEELNLANIEYVYRLWAYGCTSLSFINIDNISDCNNIYLYNCSLSEVLVDSIIEQCVTISLQDKSAILKLTGNTTPSSLGIQNAQYLSSLGWAVYHD